ncbi:potassium transporter TrkA, partial [Sulfolobus sp. F3]
MNKNEIWNRRIIPIMEIFASPYSVIRKIYLQLLMLSIVVYII